MKHLISVLLFSIALNVNASSDVRFTSDQAADLYNVVKNVSFQAFKCDSSSLQAAYTDINCRRFMAFIKKRSAFHVFNTVSSLLEAGHYNTYAANKITKFSNRIIFTKQKLEIIGF